MIGEKFGQFEVINYVDDRIDSTGKHHKRVLCRCSCGNTIIKDIYKLRNGSKMCKECYLKILPQNGIEFKHKTNKYDLTGEYGIGWTSNTNNEFYFDLEDYDKIKDICWVETNRNKYHRISGRNIITGETVSMHSVVAGKNYDHINRNPLDNRKENLRKCNQQQNTFNRSLNSNNKTGVTGVFFNKSTNKYFAYITYNSKRYNLGYFDTLEDAKNVRLEYELKFFGEFSTNYNL